MILDNSQEKILSLKKILHFGKVHEKFRGLRA